MVHNRLAVIPLLMALFLAVSSPRSFAEEEIFTAAELDQMLAPVALYPDPLLSQILMAATYPLEVVEASRWSVANPGLDGAEAVDAVEDMNWDPSVKALVAFPELLARMDDNLQWTQRLGDAYLIQEEDVIDSIQRLREEAYVAGHLNNMQYARAYRDRDIIVIEPASPQIVYVPYYEPARIYHRWWHPVYPSFYWGPPRGYHSGLSFYWGHGIHVAPVFFFSTFHWHDRHIVVVDRHHYRPYYSGVGHRERFSHAQRWSHDPRHRRGVIYTHHAPREKYGHYNASREGFGHQRDKRDPRRDDFSRDGGYHNDSNNGGRWQRDSVNQADRHNIDQRRDERRDPARNRISGEQSSGRELTSRDLNTRELNNRELNSRELNSRERGQREFNRQPSDRSDRQRNSANRREEPGRRAVDSQDSQRQAGFQQDRAQQDRAYENRPREERARQERSQRDINRSESFSRSSPAPESTRSGASGQRRSEQPDFRARPQAGQRPALTPASSADSRQRSMDARVSSPRESGRQALGSRSAAEFGSPARGRPESASNNERNSRAITSRPEGQSAFRQPSSVPQAQNRQPRNDRQEMARASERAARSTARPSNSDSARGSVASGWNGGNSSRSPGREEARGIGRDMQRSGATRSGGEPGRSRGQERQ